jgi:hypothetical protein
VIVQPEADRMDGFVQQSAHRSEAFSGLRLRAVHCLES